MALESAGVCAWITAGQRTRVHRTDARANLISNLPFETFGRHRSTSCRELDSTPRSQLQRQHTAVDELVDRCRDISLLPEANDRSVPGFELGRLAVGHIPLQRGRPAWWERVEKRHRLVDDSICQVDLTRTSHREDLLHAVLQHPACFGHRADYSDRRPGHRADPTEGDHEQELLPERRVNV